jgi:hypothetical protein
MKITKRLLIIAGAGLLIACTAHFDDYNTDKSKAGEETLLYDNLGIGGFIQKMQADVVPTSDNGANEFQRAQNLVGDIYSGYLSAIEGWNGGNNGTTYNLYYSDWTETAFKVAFTKVMPQWHGVKRYAETADPVAFSVAQIIKVMAMHRITDTYGPLPYLRFGTTHSLSTPYDSQETIYNSFFADLDSAIVTLGAFVTANPNARPLGKFDLVYGGDMEKWLRLANSLKLRLAMRLAYVRPTLARQHAEAAVAAGMLLTANNHNAGIKTALGVTIFNPLYVTTYTYDNARMNASIGMFQSGYKDPRQGKYFTEARIAGGGFHGVRHGIANPSQTALKPLSAPNVAAIAGESAPIIWMNAAEVCFLRAEGALRGWNMGDSPGNLYNRGIALSFEQWGIPAAAANAYIADSTSKPAPFQDKILTYGAPATTGITVKWDAASANAERQLERIITQKWLALYPDGQEAWSEFRRTGYPKILPVVVNNSGGTINTSLQIRRLVFPAPEYANNNAEVAKAVQMIGGKDTGGVKLWWDRKNQEL